jgi:hypothetical protein
MPAQTPRSSLAAWGIARGPIPKTRALAVPPRAAHTPAVSTFRNNLPPGPPQVAQRSLKYREQQEHLLRRLGSALVLQWDALPDDVQDLIIDQAAVVEDKSDSAHSTQDIEDFIRNAKTVAIAKSSDADG